MQGLALFLPALVDTNQALAVLQPVEGQILCAPPVPNVLPYCLP